MSSALDELESFLCDVDPDKALDEAVDFLNRKDPHFLWQLVVNAGDRHTEKTGEEHIIGDLEDALRTAVGLLSPTQRSQFARTILTENTELEAAIEDAGCDYDYFSILKPPSRPSRAATRRARNASPPES